MATQSLGASDPVRFRDMPASRLPSTPCSAKPTTAVTSAVDASSGVMFHPSSNRSTKNAASAVMPTRSTPRSKAGSVLPPQARICSSDASAKLNASITSQNRRHAER